MSDFVRTQKRVIARARKACAWNDQMAVSGIKVNRRSGAASAALLTAVMCAALAPATFAQAPFVRIAKTGDAVPGVPGATWDVVGMPAIDAEGRIAIRGSLEGPGINNSNDEIVMHGHPGQLSTIVRDGELFPQFGDGVYQRTFSQPFIAQTGQFGYDARLDGPGIDRDEDDILWAGAPGSLQVVAREGEPADGVTNGGVYSGTFASAMGRGGHVAYRTGIISSDGTESTGLWSGTPDDPRLVTYSGAPAPGTEPGVTFPASGVLVPSWTVNARGAMAFPAALEGPGIDGTNGAGIWAGTADDLGLVVRRGDAVPLPEPNARIVGGPGVGLINGNDRVLFTATVSGDGIDASNDSTLWQGSASGILPDLVIREGDEAPSLGPGYTVTGFSPFVQTEDDRVVITSRFTGPGITEENDQAILFGHSGDWELMFREGEQAPGLPAGVVLDLDLFSIDFAVTETGAAGMLLGLAGNGVSEANDEALFWRRSEHDPWQFVAREGELFDGSIVGDSGLVIRPGGGGEGIEPSINDRGELAFWIRFEDQLGDSVSGAYVIPAPAPVALIALGALHVISRRRRSGG